ncbi:MAG: response regulator [Gemmatimonadetes bacterium]|nr:response regulator [Gemmatimonadota bacterium]NIQ57100.1 response regulator [Gemmatimonadota bacterium]NIU77267.1 response regulator [Gammaproteobacteria bacterium]NIX46541.1 response regulator [Gemmatimonadota bacterium]NIY10859.1 response regulator [Gemmatimonadota bacterium]
MSAQAQTILIVDDDYDFSESTAEFLRAHGFRVLQAHSGYEGLKRARLERPDLILMDVMMEERTEGFFTVQQLRRDEGLTEIPILVVSSIYRDVPEFGVQPESQWLGDDGFLPKPLDLDALLAMIRDRLARRAHNGARKHSGAS